MAEKLRAGVIGCGFTINHVRGYLNSGRYEVVSLADLREEGEQIIEVEFDYRVEEAFLQQLPHVSTVKNTGGFVYEITFSTSKDMRPVVFDFAHDHELKTLQLSRKNKNLETLFTDLTG